MVKVAIWKRDISKLEVGDELEIVLRDTVTLFDPESIDATGFQVNWRRGELNAYPGRVETVATPDGPRSWITIHIRGRHGRLGKALRAWEIHVPKDGESEGSVIVKKIM